MIARPLLGRTQILHKTQTCRYHNARRPPDVGVKFISAASVSTRTDGFQRTSLFKRYLSNSTRLCNDGSSFVNHYEVLRMPPRATKAELKKQFYALSKETHPDRHPNDPTASKRFSQISESYSILADDEKRRRYDRDFNRVQGANRATARGEARDTYAGSRPASGLSKRRGTFRGPPPSFYAQGGYGKSNNDPSYKTSTSSQQSQDESAYQNQHQGGTFNASSFSERANTDYDPKHTFKTQSTEDIRRLQRRAAQFRAMQAEIDALSDSDFWGRFVIVTFVVALGVTVGSIIVNMSNSPRGGGLTRADGSKRGSTQNNEWAKG